MSIKFTADKDSLVAVWNNSFAVTARVLSEDVLSMRVTLSARYPSGMVTALEARCNWWNVSQTSLKASARVGLQRTSPEAEAPPSPMAVVYLDMDLPCRVGIAPVQLQALVSDLLQNVERFRTQARLEELRLSSSW
jgi:hypothetical protein